MGMELMLLGIGSINKEKHLVQDLDYETNLRQQELDDFVHTFIAGGIVSLLPEKSYRTVLDELPVIDQKVDKSTMVEIVFLCLIEVVSSIEIWPGNSFDKNDLGAPQVTQLVQSLFGGGTTSYEIARVEELVLNFKSYTALFQD
ncbi:hypothetical protein Tco_0716751 [Tanacetum coccineum]